MHVKATLNIWLFGDQSIAPGEAGTLQASGKFEGRTDGSALFINGGASFLFFNGRRLTATRWEQLDVAYRVPIILGIPTAAYFMFSLLIGAISRPFRQTRLAP